MSFTTTKNLKIMSKVKKQTRKIGVAGGFINQMMGNNSTTPVVSEGATILSYSDRTAYEVIAVSEDGNSCTIRNVIAKFVGQCYGDERYTYKSDPEGATSDLEWNDKKRSWGIVTHEIKLIKALQNRLIKEYGFDWSRNLPDGYTYDSIVDRSSGMEDFYCPLKLIKGLTKEYKVFRAVSIIFGTMDQYRDPSF